MITLTKEAAQSVLDALEGVTAYTALLDDFTMAAAKESAATLQAAIDAPEQEPVAWPKLEKPAALLEYGAATFGKGVSSRLLVEAAYRHHETTQAGRARTPAQRHDDEMNRRKAWDMVNYGIIEPKPPAPQARELSDDEILAIAAGLNIKMRTGQGAIKLARAVLAVRSEP